MTLDTSLCNILSGGDIEGTVLVVTMLGLSSQPSDSCIPLLTIIISGLLESYNLYGIWQPRSQALYLGGAWERGYPIWAVAQISPGKCLLYCSTHVYGLLVVLNFTFCVVLKPHGPLLHYSPGRQAAVQCQAMEDIHRLFQLPAHCSRCG